MKTSAITASIVANMERTREILERTQAIQMQQALTMAQLQGEATRQLAVIRSQPGLAAVLRRVEEQRAMTKVRAEAVGHPEWSNACVRCGAELRTTDDNHCAFCSVLSGR